MKEIAIGLGVFILTVAILLSLTNSLHEKYVERGYMVVGDSLYKLTKIPKEPK